MDRARTKTMHSSIKVVITQEMESEYDFSPIARINIVLPLSFIQIFCRTDEDTCTISAMKKHI